MENRGVIKMSEIKLVLSGTASAVETEINPPETPRVVPTSARSEAIPPGNSAEPGLSLATSEELSPENRERANQLAQQIDLNDSMSILRYGLAAQNRYKELTDSTFYDATRCDAEGVKFSLNQMSKLISGLDVEDFSGSFIDLLLPPKSERFPSKKLNALRQKYAKASKDLERIVKVLEGKQLALLVDIRKLDEMEDKLSMSYAELSAYITAGRQKLDAVRNGELQQLRQKAETTGQQQDALAYNNFVEQCNCLENRLQSLELTKNINLQGTLGNQLARQLDKRLAQSVQDSISNAVTAWQQGIAAAFTTKHAKKLLKEHNATLLGLINDIVGEEPTESR